MAERGLNTLADPGGSHVIYSDCDPCRRSVKLNTAHLAMRFGWHFRIDELKHRLTCRNCKARPRQIRIVYTPQSR